MSGLKPKWTKNVGCGKYNCGSETYQRLHGALQRMPVVPPELGVCSLERRVAVGLGLLDTVCLVPPLAFHFGLRPRISFRIRYFIIGNVMSSRMIMPLDP